MSHPGDSHQLKHAKAVAAADSASLTQELAPTVVPYGIHWYPDYQKRDRGTDVGVQYGE